MSYTPASTVYISNIPIIIHILHSFPSPYTLHTIQNRIYGRRPNHHTHITRLPSMTIHCTFQPAPYTYPTPP
ncbi:hypothetical protein GDO78_011377 [Eleutherodactylus coqui]|uniref:Uncharacterized protein n=1 Tax=Eleutherodactylus coqui TaxID=57060 RepID=A0A8J6K8M5_ELECQ|nr:hypothetical protein GDO78_011377 [Eleutherodactylus coqui]